MAHGFLVCKVEHIQSKPELGAILGCTSHSTSSSDLSLMSGSEVVGRSIECMLGDARMNFVYHSHSYNASAGPLITTAFLPTHVMPSAVHAIPLFERQTTHVCPFKNSNLQL